MNVKLRQADVLLINPPWLSKDQNIWHGIKGAMPSLGLLSMAAYLEEQGVSIQLLDIHAVKISTAETKEVIRQVQPKEADLDLATSQGDHEPQPDRGSLPRLHVHSFAAQNGRARHRPQGLDRR